MRDQAKQLLAILHCFIVKGKMTHCILALLITFALRHELANLKSEESQLRESRLILADLSGKGGRVRTVVIRLLMNKRLMLR